MRYSGLVLPTLILALSPIAGAHGQVTIDVSKITCEQFILYQIANADSIAVWLQGYYSAKRGTTVVDPQAFKESADKVKAHCRMNFKLTVMQAVETVLGTGK